ncbi:hypothetical protein [Bradyrhizobium sp. McL0616]
MISDCVSTAWAVERPFVGVLGLRHLGDEDGGIAQRQQLAPVRAA